ncbi:hypothetical protein JKP88DRAFT_267887 [Tribonema minus]|uniref:Uncharacterized protein n=1 Tax=Tribonema minus TaxID=303371 RepID=A0A835Z8D8_9STRA|nr:hypothetical protein JKP88DRAFT_267887 [Tribonema minus]
MLRALLLYALVSTSFDAAIAASGRRARGRSRADHQLSHHDHAAHDGALSLSTPSTTSTVTGTTTTVTSPLTTTSTVTGTTSSDSTLTSVTVPTSSTTSSTYSTLSTSVTPTTSTSATSSTSLTTSYSYSGTAYDTDLPPCAATTSSSSTVTAACAPLIPTIPPAAVPPPAVPGAAKQPTVNVKPPGLQPAAVPVLPPPSSAAYKPPLPPTVPPPLPPPPATALPAGSDLGTIDAAAAAVWGYQPDTARHPLTHTLIRGARASAGYYETTFGVSLSKSDGTLLITTASSATPDGADAIGRVIALDTTAAALPGRRRLAPAAPSRVAWARELGGGSGTYSAAYGVSIAGRRYVAGGSAAALACTGYMQQHDGTSAGAAAAADPRDSVGGGSARTAQRPELLAAHAPDAAALSRRRRVVHFPHSGEGAEAARSSDSSAPSLLNADAPVTTAAPRLSPRSVVAAGAVRGLSTATQQLGTSAYAVQLGKQRGRARRLTAVTNPTAPTAGNELGFAVGAPNPARRGAAAARRALAANEIAPIVGGTVDGAAFVTGYDAAGAAQWTAPGAQGDYYDLKYAELACNKHRRSLRCAHPAERCHTPVDGAAFVTAYDAAGAAQWTGPRAQGTTATVSLKVDGGGEGAAGVIALQTTVWPSDARSEDTAADALVLQRLDAATGAMVWATQPRYGAVGTAVASNRQHRVTVVGYEGPNVLVEAHSYKTGKERWRMKEVIRGTALDVDMSPAGLTTVVGYVPADAPRVDTDAFVLIMDSKQGTVLCYFKFGTAANDKSAAAAALLPCCTAQATGVVSSGGALYVVGQTAGPLFRADTPATAAAPYSDVFAAQFDLPSLCPLVAAHGAARP